MAAVLETPTRRFVLVVVAGGLAFAAGRCSGGGDGTVTVRGRQYPAQVRGIPLALDGDTLDLDGLRVRLFGVDAPEREQLCARSDGTRYACGQFAREVLVDIAAGLPVVCTRRDVDAAGRMVADCSGRGGDLGAQLVEAGAALALRDATPDYDDEQNRARQARSGLWEGTFENPADWRARQAQAPARP